MAGPVSHILYAEKAFAYFLQDKDERQFIVGTLFPDIRYLKVISREATHFKNVRFEDVRAESDSFRAGMLFHSLIDVTREAYTIRHHAYAGLPNSHHSTVALKICEDLQLYPRSQYWPQYINYLEDILPQEKGFCIPEEKLTEWHAMHREFFTNSSLLENKRFFFSLGFSDEQVAEIFELVHRISESGVTDTYLNGYYGNLEDILRAT
jgi:hypothetical protein